MIYTDPQPHPTMTMATHKQRQRRRATYATEGEYDDDCNGVTGLRTWLILLILKVLDLLFMLNF